MALWEAIKSAAKGNFSDAGGYLFVSQEEVDRGRRLDTQLEALVKEDYRRGIITDDQLSITMGRIEAQSFKPGGIFSQDGTNVTKGLVQGAGEGLKQLQTGVKEGIAGTLNFGAGLIPWQLWIIIAIYLGWRFGWINFKR